MVDRLAVKDLWARRKSVCTIAPYEDQNGKEVVERLYWRKDGQKGRFLMPEDAFGGTVVEVSTYNDAERHYFIITQTDDDTDEIIVEPADGMQQALHRAKYLLETPDSAIPDSEKEKRDKYLSGWDEDTIQQYEEFKEEHGIDPLAEEE